MLTTTCFPKILRKVSSVDATSLASFPSTFRQQKCLLLISVTLLIYKSLNPLEGSKPRKAKLKYQGGTDNYGTDVFSQELHVC